MGTTVTIKPKWVGTKKNGKMALCTEDEKGQATWYNFGKTLVNPLEIFKPGQTYSVKVGQDQFKNNYINGLATQETGEGSDFPKELLDETSTMPQGTPEMPGVKLTKSDILTYIQSMRAMLSNLEGEL